MKEYSRAFARLFLGLAVMAVSIVMTVETALGLAPWEVLHDGLKGLLGISFGSAGIGVGLVVVVLDLLLREKLGFGTIFNAVFLGLFVDLFLYIGFIPDFAACQGLEMLAPRLSMLVLSVFIQSFGMYLYISAGLGSGPRDSLMCALARRTKKLGVGGVRLITEAIVFVGGWLLGGAVGLGSVVLVALNGPVMELVFKLCRFDVKALAHRGFGQTVRGMFPKR